MHAFRRGSGSGRAGKALAASALLGALAGLWAPPAQAALDVSLDAARATSADVRKLGVIVAIPQTTPLWQGDTLRLKLRHEFELAAWHVPYASDLVEFGYSPVFRLEWPFAGGRSALYFDGSIGARLLSHTYISPTHRMSTAYQFADMVGMGVRWGGESIGSSTLGLRFQHESNADIKRPNPGINFLQLLYTYRF
jgi:hypothetical protein